MIEVRPCKYGRGIFATETIPKNTVINVSPLVIIPEKQLKYLEKTILWLYVFGIRRSDSAMALGLGALFNHKDIPNADYKLSAKNQTIKFTTVKKIRKGSQIFIDYGYDPTKYWNGLAE